MGDDSSDDGDDGEGIYDNDYDEDFEEDEGAAMHQHRHKQSLQDAPSLQDEEDPNPQTRKAPYPPRKKKKKKKNALTRMAQSSLSLSRKAAATTVKTSGKAAFYLMRPKSVDESELWGIWRLDQQVGTMQCTANIELTKRGDVLITSGENIVWKSPYRFIQSTWPKPCRIDFEAPAFQPPNSKKPWLLRYKCSVERKIADKKVLKLSGTLYEIERPKSMFGKDLPPRYNKIGSFVGRRRVVWTEDEDEDENERDDYSNEEADEEGGAREEPNQEEEEIEDDGYYGDRYYDESQDEDEEGYI